MSASHSGETSTTPHRGMRPETSCHVHCKAAPRPPLEALLHQMSYRLEEDDASPRCFFISGHPRSGTNWLGALLNIHPEIACTGEFTFHAMFQGLWPFVTQPGRACVREPMRSAALQAFQRFVRDSLASQRLTKPHATCVGDHTPRRLIAFVPGARYIALFRDARDIVVSWTYNALARRELHAVPESLKPKLAAQIEPFHLDPLRQHDAAKALLHDEAWVRHVASRWSQQVADDLGAIAAFNRGELSGQATTVRYEDLHDNLENERIRLYQFLEVDPAQAPPVDRASRTSTDFVMIEDPASHYRRGRVGDWREKLSDQAIRWVVEESGTELAILGYTV